MCGFSGANQMCDCDKNLRRKTYDVEDYLLLIQGVAKTLLSLSDGSGQYETVFHYLGMTLSDYRDAVYALVVDGEDDEGAPAPEAGIPVSETVS
jgi:hypothetical protein